MNVLFIVVDSLRYDSLWLAGADRPRTPFLEQLDRQSISFRRAYAPECWTLPAHVSFFTGRLPSEHGAHFQHMAYVGRESTLAEILAERSHATELLTRNSLLDGTIPGVTRGFTRNDQVLAEIPRGLTPFLLVLALAKPRVRRFMRRSGFFSMAQKDRASFLVTLARMGLPADVAALERALARMHEHRSTGKRYFLFLNLYDVHAPYSPSETSPLRPVDSLAALHENLSLTWVLPKISSHAYLKPGFRLSARSRRMLLDRYHRAIALMDEKLRVFFEAADASRLLDDTLVVVTSDHGEGFGEHGLYLHDASLYETHLHVPLWVRHPDGPTGIVDDVVGTRDLFRLLTAPDPRGGTILDDAARGRQPAAFAEHFHYPHLDDVQVRYRTNQRAVVTRRWKVIARRRGIEAFDLQSDAAERRPITLDSPDAAHELWRGEGLSDRDAAAAKQHLARILTSSGRDEGLVPRPAGRAIARSTMYPVLHPFDFHIASHLAMLVLAVVVCHVLGPWLGQRLEGIRPLAVSSALIWLGLAAFAGGRAHFVWNAWSFGVYASQPLQALRFWEGLHAGGAFLGLVLAAPLVLRAHGITFGQFADVIAPTIVIGIAVARVGCFLQGCCFGTPSDLPWAMSFPAGSPVLNFQLSSGIAPAGAARSMPVHPLQLYFSAAGLVAAAAGLWAYRYRTYRGRVALVVATAFLVLSAVAEEVRAPYYPRLYFWGASLQFRWIAIAMAGSAFIALAWAELAARARGRAPLVATGHRTAS